MKYFAIRPINNISDVYREGIEAQLRLIRWEEVFLGFYRWWDMDGKWYKDVWWRLNARQAGKVNFPKVYFC